MSQKESWGAELEALLFDVLEEYRPIGDDRDKSLENVCRILNEHLAATAPQKKQKTSRKNQRPVKITPKSLWQYLLQFWALEDDDEEDEQPKKKSSASRKRRR
mmetsp:Transcript_20874/g.31086  ORF Transcript_20874/g.31086 Transcript_20874/m.31086 type:complete len:103 (+) Transcript_20874:100-408(+)